VVIALEGICAKEERTVAESGVNDDPLRIRDIPCAQIFLSFFSHYGTDSHDGAPHHNSYSDQQGEANEGKN
jgi:hypothetical protein